MSSLGSWRFTAILGAVAVLGTGGVLSWAMVTVSNLKSEAPQRAAAPLSSEKSKTFAAALAAGPSEPSLSDWNDELDWLSKKSMSNQMFVAPRASAGSAEPYSQAQAPDLPLSPAPVPRSEPEHWRTQQSLGHQAEHRWTPEPRPAEPRVRVQRHPSPEPAVVAAARPQPPKPHRVVERPSYLEKVVEQGDAGEVKFHFRRQVCSPRHMVDVCYMPAENRRSILVQRW
jgi:hypothetical protein